MKEEEIKIRISKELREDFISACANKNATMSNVITEHITEEVNEYKRQRKALEFNELIKSLGFNNIKLVHMPIVKINLSNREPMKYGEVIPELLERVCVVEDYRTTLFDFVTKHKDETIYLYLEGCDFKINLIRGFTINEKLFKM